jgi:ferredoxin--NADP+ reductase
MLDGRVISNVALTSRLYALRIEVSLSPFEAGQFVRLQLTINGEKVAKPYSLVNAPDDPVAEVFFNTVPGGLLSNALAELQAGDSVGISQPATGFFTLNGAPAARDLWLIATGTGLGPYLSILRTTQLWERFERVVLVHGVPLREELAYQNITGTIQRERGDRFQYISCVSRENNPNGYRGRVTDALDCGELERRAGFEINQSDSAVMLCGNHSMITDMQALLAQRDMRKHLRHKPGQIIIEQYF